MPAAHLWDKKSPSESLATVSLLSVTILLEGVLLESAPSVVARLCSWLDGCCSCVLLVVGIPEAVPLGVALLPYTI